MPGLFGNQMGQMFRHPNLFTQNRMPAFTGEQYNGMRYPSFTGEQSAGPRYGAAYDASGGDTPPYPMPMGRSPMGSGPMAQALSQGLQQRPTMAPDLFGGLPTQQRPPMFEQNLFQGQQPPINYPFGMAPEQMQSIMAALTRSGLF